MTKSKNKSIIALVVMAFMLVASIALAATGAWFTDKLATESKTFTFGSVDIAWAEGNTFKLDDAAITENQQVLPGCKITYEGTINNEGASNAYVVVQITATLSNGLTWADVGDDDPSSTKLQAINVGKTQAVSATIELPTSLKDQNKLAGKTITTSVTVYAIQEHHLDSIQDWSTMNEAAKCAKIIELVNANGDTQGLTTAA